MNPLEHVHEGCVAGRRVQILCRHVAPLVPPGAQVIDVGCGDGLLARLLMQARPDIRIRGFDVLVRPQAQIPVEPFDGRKLPIHDASIDAVLFVDTLHHTVDPMVLLREAARVSRHAIIIKDHTADGILAQETLRLMDQVGNARHGVALPYTYWPKAKWDDAFGALGLSVSEWKPKLGLYPWPFRWLFDRSLHFVAKLFVSR